MPHDSHRLIYQAWRQGRSIVPFLGSGISVPAGFPTTSELLRYFALLSHFIEHGAYRRGIVGQVAPERNSSFAYEVDPSRYIADLGWPDPHQLRADIWRDREHPIPHQPSQGRHFAVDVRIGDEPPSGSESLANSIGGRRDEVSAFLAKRDSLHRLTQRELLDELSEREPHLAESLRRQLEGAPGDWSTWKLLYGDWNAMLTRLSGGNQDYIDSLFDMLGQGRKPAASHLYLAFLTRLMGIQLFLTTNFDRLLELGMISEGLAPAIFDISRDAPLPPPALVRQSLSIVKLHGSAYGLRVGSRLDEALDPDARERALLYVPQDALVVVLGFSGSERRMVQLIEAVALRDAGRNQPTVLWLHLGESPPRALERLAAALPGTVVADRIGDASTFLAEVYSEAAGSHPVAARPYQALWPSAMRSVQFPQQAASPVIATPQPSQSTSGTLPIPLDKRPVQLFVTFKEDDSTEPDWGTPCSNASLSMARFVEQHTRNGARLIWVDAEEHDTLSGLITEILEGMRHFDPGLSRFLLPAGVETDRAIPAPQPGEISTRSTTNRWNERAANRIREAMQRGAYVLAIDGLDSFPRPETVHHGIPTFEENESWAGQRERRSSRLQQLQSFLLELSRPKKPASSGRGAASEPSVRVTAEEVLYDSYICLAMTAPTLREGKNASGEKDDKTPGEGKKLPQFVIELFQQLLRDLQQHSHVAVRPCLRNDAEVPESRPSAEALRQAATEAMSLRKLPQLENSMDLTEQGQELFLGLSSFFRVPRDREGLLAAIADFLPHGAKLRERRDRLERWLSQERVVKAFARLEGPCYWMRQEYHQSYYRAMTHGLHATTLFREGDGVLASAPYHDSRQTLAGLCFVAGMHRRIALYYFSEAFVASREPRAFREYLYHRVSSLRYMATLERYVHTSLGATPPSVGKHTEQESHLDDLQAVNSEETNELASEVAKWLTFLERRDGAADRELTLGLAAERIRVCRSRDLEALITTLIRERPFLLSSATSDTWLSWVTLLLEVDLPQMIHDRAVLEQDGALNAVHGRLKQELDVLRAELLWRKADYRNCLRYRTESIIDFVKGMENDTVKHAWLDCLAANGVNGNIGRDSRASPDRPADSKAGESCADNSAVRGEYLSKLNEAIQRASTKDLNRQLKHVRKNANSFRRIATAMAHSIKCMGEIGEIQLAISMSDAARQWHLEVSTRSGVVQRDDLQPRLDDWRLQNEAALFHALHDRYQPFVDDGCLSYSSFMSQSALNAGGDDARSATTERPGCRGEKIDELSRFTQRAAECAEFARRARYDNSEEYYLWRSTFSLAQARMLYLQRHFFQALQLLDLAQGGLNVSDDRQRHALIMSHCDRAECLMLSADESVRHHDILAKLENAPLPIPADQCVLVASRKLITAETSLRTAWDLLQEDPNNVTSWYRWYTLHAQLCVERLLLFVKSPHEAYTERSWSLSAAQLQRILSSALSSLRGGFDCILPFDSEANRSGGFFDQAVRRAEDEKWKRLLAIWKQLLIAGAVLSRREVMRQYHPRSLEREVMPMLEEYWRAWRWMNESARLDRLCDDAIKLEFVGFCAHPNLNGRDRTLSAHDGRNDCPREQLLELMRALIEHEGLHKKLEQRRYQPTAS